MTIRSRVKGRGAALVEAGIVAPLFAMMFILHVYIAGVYEAKIESAQEARGNAFFYAGNNCKASTGHIDSGSGAGTDNNANNQGRQGIPDAPQGSNSQIMIGSGHGERTFNNPIGGNANGNYQMPNQTLGVWQTKTVTTDSYVMCNEGPYGMNAFSYIGGMISQAF